MAKSEDFRAQLRKNLDAATASGKSHLDVNAGDLHREAGGYPGPNHRMPVCCGVMHKEMENSGGEITAGPSSGQGASLTIRYKLPR